LKDWQQSALAMSPLAFLASTPHTNAAKIFLNWILTREGQNQFQKLIFPNKASSIRFSFSILTGSIFSPGLEEFKDKDQCVSSVA